MLPHEIPITCIRLPTWHMCCWLLEAHMLHPKFEYGLHKGFSTMSSHFTWIPWSPSPSTIPLHTIVPSPYSQCSFINNYPCNPKFSITFLLNLEWKMVHFVPTFNGTSYHHTFKQHVYMQHDKVFNYMC